MSPAICLRLADEIVSLGEELTVIWHGGEPLACGIHRFEQLLEPFADRCRALVRHGLQTNATLIDDKWCDLFEKHRIQVGASIDGASDLNHNRVDWSGRATFEPALRGIRFLQKRNINYSVIAVVGESSLGKAKELYRFFADLGCTRLGINIEEQEGANRKPVLDDERVTAFWEDLFEAWLANPAVTIREFSTKIQWLLRDRSDPTSDPFNNVDIFPSVAYNGDVVLLSPELLGVKDPRHENFIVGNLLRDSLRAIVFKGASVPYVRQYVAGVKKCHAQCEYFNYCGGGQASNKYFELDDISGTETGFCRNMSQRLVQAILAKS